MTTASPILDSFGRPHTRAAEPPRPRALRQRVRAASEEELAGSYDAAQTTDSNRRHWANADSLSAAAAANPEVRGELRSRARYECQENNSFGVGLVQSLPCQVVGRGPRLQLETPDQRVNHVVERAFNLWAREIRLGSRLRTARVSKAVDGEIFIVPKTNNRLRNRVKLDVRLLEGDQVTTPGFFEGPNAIDGVRFDEEGNPTEYDVLPEHPGDTFAFTLDPDVLPAESVIHWFRETRPEQRRGIPEVTPALPLFALLRRFTLATVRAGETAADWAAVMWTDAAAQSDPDSAQAMDAIELEMGAMLTLPAGWKLGQIKQEHPATTYEMFRNALVGEIARCLLVPFNKAVGTSQGYTFASGKLDRDDWLQAVEVDRDEGECVVLDRLLGWWLDEASLVPGLLPNELNFAGDLPTHSWQWDGHRETDPAKQANADATLWDRGLLNDDELLHRRGVDPDRHFERLKRRLRQRRELGLPVPGATSPSAVQDDDERDDETGKPEGESAEANHPQLEHVAR